MKVYYHINQSPLCGICGSMMKLMDGEHHIEEGRLVLVAACLHPSSQGLCQQYGIKVKILPVEAQIAEDRS